MPPKAAAKPAPKGPVKPAAKPPAKVASGTKVGGAATTGGCNYIVYYILCCFILRLRISPN